jgi:hypothetical protein
MDEGSARVVNVERREVCELAHISEISSTTKSIYNISAISHCNTRTIYPNKNFKQSSEYNGKIFKAVI